jgi:hypothetical protein
MRSPRLLRSLASTAGVLIAATACGPAKPPTPTGPVVPAFRGLLATPPQLAFTCVIPGCDNTLTVKVQSNVNRRVAIKRIVLSKDNEQYTVTPDQAPPFILGAASDFAIDVRFAPTEAPRSESLDLLVTYTDASAEESADRIEAGELKIPLVKRLVGEPLLAVNPPSINFGVVPPMMRKEVAVAVKNVGFGNIAMEVDRADSGTSLINVGLPQDAALIPDASVPVAIVFAPRTEGYLRGQVLLGSSTPGVDPVLVAVEGTSFAFPRVTLEPEETALEFGEIPKGQRQQVTVRLANVGGQALDVTSLSAVDPTMRVKVMPDGGMTSGISLMPLQRMAFAVEVNGTTPGPIDVPLQIVSNDPVRPTVDIPIRAVITEPRISASPAMLDWGTVPNGWVVGKQIELRNTGYGTLTVKSITFIGGSSNLYSFRNLPSIPARLQRDERVAFDVEFRAQTNATLGGSVSIETDDPINPFIEVPLTATVGTCAMSCPITNGTPSCSNGECTIGSCNMGWYDTDQQASNGCECRDIGSDPGGFCTMGLNKGTLRDNGSSANHTGIIGTATDEDYIIFYAQDDSQLFSDDYDVHISLSSSDPNITMCVGRYDTGVSVNECYPDSNKVCGIRSYRHDGSLGREDGAMFYLKVYRTNATPTCISYTVYMSNG